MAEDKPGRPVIEKIDVGEEEIQSSSAMQAQQQTPQPEHRGQNLFGVDQKSPSMTPNGPADNLTTPPTIARNRATPRSTGTPPKLENLPLAVGMAARTPRTLRDVTAGPLSARTAWNSQLSARSAPRSARLLLSSRSYRGGMSYRLMQDEAGSPCPRTQGLDTQAAARQAARKIADLLSAQAKQRRLQDQLALQVEEDPSSDNEEQAGKSDLSSHEEEGLMVEREGTEGTEGTDSEVGEAAMSTRKDPLTRAEAKGFFNSVGSGSDTPSAKAACVAAYFDSTAPEIQSKKKLPPTPRALVTPDSDSCIVFGADINSFQASTLTEYKREAKGSYSVMKLVDESVITRHKGPRRAFIPDVRPFIIDNLPSETPRDSFLSRLFAFGSASQPRPQQPSNGFTAMQAVKLPKNVASAVIF